VGLVQDRRGVSFENIPEMHVDLDKAKKGGSHMANEIFRSRAKTQIDLALSEYKAALTVDHHFLQGRIREIALDKLFRPFLPGDFDIGTGKIVDSHGEQSREVDLILYSKFILSPIMYSEREGVFPAESCFYAIEVKSTLNAQELKDAFEKADDIRKLYYSSGIYTEQNLPLSTIITYVIPVLFAFNTDLIEGGKSELDRYKDIDSNAELDPRLRAICIAGRGYWYFCNDSWIFSPATQDKDEIINFLSGVINTIPDSFIKRGRPRLGVYLVK